MSPKAKGEGAPALVRTRTADAGEARVVLATPDGKRAPPTPLEKEPDRGGGQTLATAGWRGRILQWLSDEALPLWTVAGLDDAHGGFFEALTMDGKGMPRAKRMRTMARQIYAFAVAAERGWNTQAADAVSRGLSFISARGRSGRGGWIRSLAPDGSVLDDTEDLYDTACVLLALAHAHRCGESRARALAEETFFFLERHLRDHHFAGYRETGHGGTPRRANPHMHMLEAFLAWFDATGDGSYLEEAAGIADLFRHSFFHADSWTVGEYFEEDWKPARGRAGALTEPGHHFEWAALLVAFAMRTGQLDLLQEARRIHSTAVTRGINRRTGLAYGVVTRSGRPVETLARSWPQAEALKAAIALDDAGEPDMKPEIEARLERLFRWHIDPAPHGLWVDRIDAEGLPCAPDVPASIFYHLVCALTHYLDHAAPREPVIRMAPLPV
jgi:mannose/cellobiose epimerase-like protein (N-acyl-D-glucosamine 2-epimerase family)